MRLGVWITSNDRQGRECAKAHFYLLTSADALCGFGGYTPRVSARKKARCKHCQRLARKQTSK